MTILWPSEPASAAAPGSRPAESAWAELARRVAELGDFPAPALLRVDVPAYPPILIDLRHGAFTTPLEIGRYPVEPAYITVSRIEAPLTAGPAFELPGQDLDALLWRVGGAVGGTTPAEWTRPGERYRLVRWPNFVRLNHHPDHIRMSAMLATGFFTAGELAAAAGTAAGDAQRVLNALALMRAVERSVAAEPVALVAPAPDAPKGLFRRLRMRLGR
jgi:hypothetical protein